MTCDKRRRSWRESGAISAAVSGECQGSVFESVSSFSVPRPSDMMTAGPCRPVVPCARAGVTQGWGGDGFRQRTLSPRGVDMEASVEPGVDGTGEVASLI